MQTNFAVQESINLLNIDYKFDRILSFENKLKASDVLRFIFDDRLTPFPKKKSQKGIYHSSVAPGWVHIAKNKNDLIDHKHNNVVRTYSTLLYYINQGYEYFTYATFHTKKRMYFERNRKNINSCHAFVIDIDTKIHSIDDIVEFSLFKFGFKPSFINETPRGYHIWYVLANEVTGKHTDENNNITKVGSFYNDINKFIVGEYEKQFPKADGKGTDYLVGGERYIRIPLNVVFWSGEKQSINAFVDVRNRLYPKLKHINKKNKSNTYIPFVAIQKDEAYKKLLCLQAPEGERRNAAFTIALLFNALKYPKGRAEEHLLDWYNNLTTKYYGHRFTWKDVLNALSSAYSGKYKAPSPKYIYNLTGIKPKIYFTHKLDPIDRVNNTLSNWERLFVDLLKQNGGKWQISTLCLLKAMDMTSKSVLNTMIINLINRNIIKKVVEGKGRYATTTYILINNNNDKKPIKNNVIFLTSHPKFFSKFNIPKTYMNIVYKGWWEGFT